MSTNIQEAVGRILAQSGLGPVRATAWQNFTEEGEKRGMSVSLSKSFQQDGSFQKSTCSLKVSEVSAAIAVLQDIERQLLATSRELTARQQGSAEPETAEF